MVLTGAERAKRWRQKQREDPHKHYLYKQKEKERYEKRKDQGKIIPIKEMGKRKQRKVRRNWRKNQRNKREREKQIKKAVADNITPPMSPEHEYNVPNEGRINTMRQLGRKRVRRDRSMAYRRIDKLNVALFRQKQLISKYKMRYMRLKRKCQKPNLQERVDSIIRKKESRKAMLVLQAILERTRQRYNATKNIKEKRKISSLMVSAKVLKKLRLMQYSKNLFGFSNRQMIQTKNREVKTPRTIILVREFLERDDNSRVKAGKNYTITRKGEKRQIRLLCDDLKHLHGKFLTETNVKISYSLFCRFKPFHILKPTCKDRETCLCKTHENLHFKINRCYQERAISRNDEESLLKSITCNIDDKRCMYRECDICKNKTVAIQNPNVDIGKQTWWYEWKNRRIEKEKVVNGEMVKSMVNRTVKEKEEGTLETLSEELNKEVQRATRHIFNIRHQYKTLRYLRENITHDEIIMQIDFSENYNCKYSQEIQSMHFGASKRQISLHTGVAYTDKGIYSFCSLSDCLKHGPASIWAHLHPILEELQRTMHATKIHFISDGPTTQYRNKQNFFLFSTRPFDVYGFTEASWNFLEAGHGKGAADGIGGVIKRKADSYVNKGGDINNASDMTEALTYTSVNIFQVAEEDINNVEATLPTTLKPLPNTMKLHQVLASSLKPREVKFRVLSCFCQKPNLQCQCYDLATAEFPVQTSELQTELGMRNIGTPTHTTTVADSTPMEDELPSHSDVRLIKLDVVDESLVSKYCVVLYDGQPFPGIVLAVDDEEELEVQTMHRIGKNRYFWPMRDDTLWYSKHQVVTLLLEPPKLVTNRHHQIDPKVWCLIENELNL